MYFWDSVIWCMNIYGSYILIVDGVLIKTLFSLNLIFSVINIITSAFSSFIIFMVCNMFPSSVMLFWFSVCFLSSLLFISFLSFHCFIICLWCFNDSMCSGNTSFFSGMFSSSTDSSSVFPSLPPFFPCFSLPHLFPIVFLPSFYSTQFHCIHV